MKTLKEVCAELGVSRRAVQGYEAVGLVKASRKNKYGYLLYGKRDVNRIKKIKFFQDLGFTLKDIQTLIDAPKEILKPKIEDQIKLLVKEIYKKEQAIEKAKEFIKALDE